MKAVFKIIFSYLVILAGSALASFSVACILLPNDAIDYGTAGIAIIISKLTGGNLSILVISVFLPFLAAGAFYLGRKFSFKALVGSIGYTVGLAVFEEIPFVLDTENYLAVAFGGALLGLGLSLILRFGGCIDGSEILANIIIKKLSDKTGKHYSMTYILIVFNAFVYGAAFLLIDQNAALMSLLVYVVATVVIDHYTGRFESVKQVTIISQHPDNIIASIKNEMNKACTIINSRGAIAGDNKVLICYVNYFELQKLRDIISRNKGSFSTVSNIEEILR